MTPTQQAENHFRSAQMHFDIEPSDQLGGLSELAEGLRDLAVGLRATYQKLDEIERLIKTTHTGPNVVGLIPKATTLPPEVARMMSRPG